LNSWKETTILFNAYFNRFKHLNSWKETNILFNAYFNHFRHLKEMRVLKDKIYDIMKRLNNTMQNVACITSLMQ